MRGMISAALHVTATSTYDDTFAYLGSVVLAAVCSCVAGKAFFVLVERPAMAQPRQVSRDVAALAGVV